MDMPKEEKVTRAKIKEAYKQMYCKKFNLEGIDLTAELELIKQKKSKLSRRQRDAVIGFAIVFPTKPANSEIEDIKIEEPATKEDLNKVTPNNEPQDK